MDMVDIRATFGEFSPRRNSRQGTADGKNSRHDVAHISKYEISVTPAKQSKA